MDADCHSREDGHELFCRSTKLPAPVDALWAYHGSMAGFERLNPPFAPVRVLSPLPRLEAGAEMRLRGRWPGTWVSRVREIGPYGFADEQVRGPFASWEHAHVFTPRGAGDCLLTDKVRYDFPFLPVPHGMLRRRIGALFAFRHRLILGDCQRYSFPVHTPMHVLVSGGTGLLGRPLVALLRLMGHRVTVLTRTPRMPGDLGWDPRGMRPADLPGDIDAVIHLAGENIGRRWTPEVRQEILDSRVGGTRRLCDALLGLPNLPKVFVSASAIGYYGDLSGGALPVESAPPGSDFLAGVCVGWEGAAEPLARAGVRVAHMRMGVVLDPRGGMLARLLPLFRVGLGGRVGRGDQRMGWVGVYDAVDAYVHALTDPRFTGPFNLVAGSDTNRGFSRTLARVLGRPCLVPVPAPVLRVGFGGMAGGMLLADSGADASALLGTGFEFREDGLEDTLRFLLGRPERGGGIVVQPAGRVCTCGSDA